MAAFVICYDLNKPGQDYQGLYDAIKSYGTHWHPVDSTWIVVSDSDAVTIRDFLMKKMDANDKLLVFKLSGEAAWTGFNKETSDWLKRVLK